MRRERLAVFIQHFIGIAVVCRYEKYAIHIPNCLCKRAYTGIHRFHCFNSSRNNACVANHIAVCKIYDYNIIFSASYSFIQLFGNFGRTHFGH